MRIYTNSFPVEWSTAQKPSLIIDNLKTILKRLKCLEVIEQSKYKYKLTIDASLQCEVELMKVENAPFITVVRVLRKTIQINKNATPTG